MTPTILVVEDNPTTLKMLRLALESEGYRVVEASDGRSALAAVETSRPDLVLQDLILPDMDGLDLVRRLRALDGCADLPVVALSGFLSRLEELRTTDVGFTLCLVKPIEPSRLVEALRIYLPRRGVVRLPAAQPARLLLVDDDPAQLKLARVHFGHGGFDVSAATSVDEALRMAEANRPDVILSDVLMPAMDGFQLCLAIRNHPRLKQVPLVLQSAYYGSQDDADLARRVGANALVVRTPDCATAYAAVMDALHTGAPAVADAAGPTVESRHVQLIIRQLEQHRATVAGLAQRCAMQAAQLSLLGGVADALAHSGDTEVVLRDVLAATLDAAGISKGALVLRQPDGRLEFRQNIGFSSAELERLRTHAALVEETVNRGGSVSVPSSMVQPDVAEALLASANVATLHIVPLVADGRGMGAMIIGATRTDVTTEDSVVFARAIGNQLVQSLELARSIASLRASEQRYRTLLDNATDIIAVLTPDGVVTEVNRRCEEVVGVSREEMLGRDFESFKPGPREGHRDSGWPPAGEGHGDGAPPVEFARPDGSRLLVEFATATVDVGGEQVVFTIGRDVTERQRLEMQLRQAQKLEAIGQLAGGIAHDFNNLLTAILGFADLAAASLPPADPARVCVSEVRRAGERAADLTRQLLAFGRQQLVQPRVLDINDVIRGIEPLIRRLIRENVQLMLALGDDVPPVRMDPTHIEQVLVNLATNAADAMPHGGTLTVATSTGAGTAGDLPPRAAEEPELRVRLAVHDTGTGMDDATLQHIFEPFFTTKASGRGTGLGLATVYGIVKQNGGDIRVSSMVGRGTTFEIELPAVPDAPSAPVEAPRKAAEPPRGAETVLLVEDDEAVRYLTRLMLEHLGYQVLEAGSPRQADAVVQTFDAPIHLLLSDVVMPDSEGPPLLDRLRPGRPDLRVLYMSGYADDAVLRQGVLVGTTPFLQKPFDAATLARKVRAVLDAPTGH
jgi:PAS domain S-box-containing protein